MNNFGRDKTLFRTFVAFRTFSFVSSFFYCVESGSVKPFLTDMVFFVCFSGLSSAGGGNGTLRDPRPLKRKHDGDEDESLSPNKKLVMSLRSSLAMLRYPTRCCVTSVLLVLNVGNTPSTRPTYISRLVSTLLRSPALDLLLLSVLTPRLTHGSLSRCAGNDWCCRKYWHPSSMEINHNCMVVLY